MPYADPEKQRAATLAAGRRWYAKNRKKKIAAVRQRCADDPERRRMYMRRYRIANAEKLRVYNARWEEENQEKKRARVARHRALKVSAPQGDAVLAADYEQVLRQGVCEQCGSRGPVHIDHIEPLSTGGEHGWENFAGLCQSCNSRKGTKSLLLGMLT